MGYTKYEKQTHKTQTPIQNIKSLMINIRWKKGIDGGFLPKIFLSRFELVYKQTIKSRDLRGHADWSNPMEF